MPFSVPTPSLLIFDLDGTLVDTGPQITRAWGQILTGLGRSPLPQAEVEIMVGDGAAKLVERGLAATGGAPRTPSFDDIVDHYVDVLAAEPISAGDLYSGVMATLEQLATAGHKLAVCTNKPVPAAETALSMTEILGFFDLVIGAGSTPSLKPDPAPVRAILNHFGCNPDDAVMIGDHENDIKAASAAGVSAILVTYGYPNQDWASHTQRRIDRFDELTAALRGE